jgi:hypothetical protein
LLVAPVAAAEKVMEKRRVWEPAELVG